MSFNRNKNLKIVGFFGRSGAGKTTTIRNVDKRIDGRVILQNVGIIRYLFRKNHTSYLNPEQIVKENLVSVESMTDEKKRDSKIDELYDKYIRSQIQLLNDWSTELYLASKETYSTPSVLLVDRSPIDFYALTVCGMNRLKKAFKKEPFHMQTYFIELCRKIAEDNTNNFLNAIFVTKPWKAPDINKLQDGIRDQYLTEDYTGNNWYSNYDDINLRNEVSTFFIGSDISDLKDRADFVGKKLMEV